MGSAEATQNPATRGTPAVRRRSRRRIALTAAGIAIALLAVTAAVSAMTRLRP
jgi:hypothetical protein